MKLKFKLKMRTKILLALVILATFFFPKCFLLILSAVAYPYLKKLQKEADKDLEEAEEYRKAQTHGSSWNQDQTFRQSSAFSQMNWDGYSELMDASFYAGLITATPWVSFSISVLFIIAAWCQSVLFMAILAILFAAWWVAVIIMAARHKADQA